MSGSHALLLRLFQSQSFFSVHLALQYLNIYSDNIGITHYLTGRLRELGQTELDDVWGFICHLLVTRPSKSCALETFVVERAEQSTHSALLTLFFLQAHLADLSTTRRDTPSFAICQRVLLKVQNIIFSDPPSPPTTPYNTLSPPSSLGSTFRSRFWKRKVKPRIGPALVGMGTILAGVPGLPELTANSGAVAVEQGRISDDTRPTRPVQATEDETSSTSYLHARPSNPVEGEERNDSLETLDPEEDGPDEEEDVEAFGRPTMPRLNIPPEELPTILSRNQSMTSLTMQDSQATSPGTSSRRMTLGASATNPSLPRSPRRTLPLDRRTSSPSQSVPSLSLRSPLSQLSGFNPDAVLQRLDIQTQVQLLQGHYCRSEVQFLLTLESISNRLLVIPKLARVSALRAELTALNHKLPAEVDIPMWTSDPTNPVLPSRSANAGHSRVVRIPPGESVVLNSAERAPYLLLVEVLTGDLDFVPTKRANKDVLRRLITKEHKPVGGDAPESNPLRLYPSKTNSHLFGTGPDVRSHASPIDSVALNGQGDEPSPVVSSFNAKVVGPEPFDSQEEEEMDLVEQTYGTDLSVRSPTDLSESIVLPPPPKNKALDLATWSKGTSTPRSASPGTPNVTSNVDGSSGTSSKPSSLPDPKLPPAPISLEDYSERMRTAAIMLAQLNSSLVREPVTTIAAPNSLSSSSVPLPPATSESTWTGSSALKWIPGTGWMTGSSSSASPSSFSSYPTAATRSSGETTQPQMRMKLQPAEASAIREKIMTEMMALEEERMERMRETAGDDIGTPIALVDSRRNAQSAEDESIVRRELNKVDPSAAVFRESWVSKKARIRSGSPYGHLANWDCISVIVKTGADLRQEQMAVQLIQIFERIWKQEGCACWVQHFRILITGSSSGLVETIKDAVSIHSIKKAEYARRIAEGQFGHVSLYDHFVQTYGDPSSVKFTRAQQCFARSLAGYSLVTYLLQIKDRHNGNILLDRDGHLIHIDFGFMLSNSPGNMGFEAAPFKFPLEYVEVLGGLDSPAFKEFKRLFREGFEVARKHCDSIITIVELMQKDSSLDCFAAFGEQTSQLLRDRFQQGLPHSAIGDHVERLIMSSMGSHWTRLYDSFQYYSQSIL